MGHVRDIAKMYAAGGPPRMSQATYRNGSDDLLRAVEDPCRRRGIRCTDAAGNGLRELLVFKCE